MLLNNMGIDLFRRMELNFIVLDGIKMIVMDQKDKNHRNKDENEEIKAEKQILNSYVKYTGVAFQMMAIIGLSAYIGYKTDQYYDHKTQWVTATACVLGVFLSIYQTIRQLK